MTAAKVGYSTVRYGQRQDTDPGTVVDLADSQTRTRIDIVLPRNSNVMGRVVDEFGDPVENAAVALSQIRFQGGRRRLVGVSAMSGRTTDDLGRYRIYAVPAGDYVVTASVGQVVPFEPGMGVSGYATTYFPSTTNTREAQQVSVPRSQDVPGVDFVLVPTPTAMISGKKIGSDGQPFGGSLTLTPSQRSGAIATPPTGARIYDDGRFEFPNVAPGDYVIQARPGEAERGARGTICQRVCHRQRRGRAGRAAPGDAGLDDQRPRDLRGGRAVGAETEHRPGACRFRSNAEPDRDGRRRPRSAIHDERHSRAAPDHARPRRLPAGC